MSQWIKSEEIGNYPRADKQEAIEAMKQCICQVKNNLERYGNRFPEDNSEKGFYGLRENRGWTTGFWTGEVWLSYENSRDKEEKAFFESRAKDQVMDFYERIQAKTDVDHHDMGFLYSPSCVAAYKLTGMEEAKKAALLAADNLIGRFQPVGNFIQAWGAFGAEDNYRFIIDCLLNLPLLYWASQETGKEIYRDVAQKHIHTAMKYIFREDNSTWHTVFLDRESGEFSHGATCQGYKDGSAWTRGQAWGIYGTAMAFKYTGQKEYMEYFRRVTGYYLAHLPKDLCPYWDLTFGDEAEGSEPRDSSSAAIAACGMLEMSKYLEGGEADYYQGVARAFIKTLIDNYQVKDAKISDGQLLRGTYCKKTPYNTCRESGVDECVIWGDYYFMEALNRIIHPDWELYW